MLRNAAISIVLAVSCLSGGCATVAVVTSPLTTAQQYSRAYIVKDWERVVALTHPRVLKAAEGAMSFRAELESIASASEFWPIGEQLSSAAECAIDRERLAVIKTQRTYGFLQGERQLSHVYLAHSIDEGRSWSIVDMSCTNPETARTIMPRLRDNKCGTVDLETFFPAQ